MIKWRKWNIFNNKTIEMNEIKQLSQKNYSIQNKTNAIIILFSTTLSSYHDFFCPCPLLAVRNCCSVLDICSKFYLIFAVDISFSMTFYLVDFFFLSLSPPLMFQWKKQRANIIIHFLDFLFFISFIFR